MATWFKGVVIGWNYIKVEALENYQSRGDNAEIVRGLNTRDAEDGQGDADDDK